MQEAVEWLEKDYNRLFRIQESWDGTYLYDHNLRTHLRYYGDIGLGATAPRWMLETTLDTSCTSYDEDEEFCTCLEFPEYVGSIPVTEAELESFVRERALPAYPEDFIRQHSSWHWTRAYEVSKKVRY